MNTLTAKNLDQHGICRQSGPVLSPETVADAPGRASVLIGDLLLRWLQGLKCRLACVLFGHEKWIVSCGDWVCMHCGHVKYVETLVLPDDPNELRAALKSLEQDQDELRAILKSFDG